jgi:hypothetical protein
VAEIDGGAGRVDGDDDTMQEKTDSCEQHGGGKHQQNFCGDPASGQLVRRNHKIWQNGLPLLTIALSVRPGAEHCQARALTIQCPKQRAYEIFPHKTTLQKEDSLYLMTSKNSLFGMISLGLQKCSSGEVL